MDTTEMRRLFEAHREAETARDIDGILRTFVEDCLQYFTAFPDLTPEDEGITFGDGVIAANVVPFRDGLMAGEAIYFDLATLCEQAGIPLDRIRAAATARRAGTAAAAG